MRSIIIKVVALLLPIALIAAYKTYTEDQKDKEKIVLELLMSGLKYAHYDNIPVDDQFSEKVFDSYIEGIDYTKKFLLESDYTQLKAYRLQLDDQLNALNLDFFDLSYSILTKRISEVEALYENILSEPFQFDLNDELELDDKKNSFAKSKDELKDSWRKSLKYQVMLEMVTQLEIQEAAAEKKDTSIAIKDFTTIEKEAREKVKKRNQDYLHRLSQMERKDFFSLYLNSVSACFDPHTNYFPPKDKEDFDIAMSGQLEGIGATLQEKDGFIKVVQIMPGSPSYKQGELKAGDLILKVTQENGETVEISGMRIDKAVTYIRGKKGTTVKLTVKTVEGDIKQISIVRDIVVIEETYAKSAIIKSPSSNKNIGYIYLPSFYVNFNEKGGGRRCSDDVRKEVIKLKNQGIDGLIIDLRNDGGGSLPDVVTMAGLFIPTGPIVQVRQKTGAPEILSDNDPSVLYDGPMAVMVNSNSASASEIFAGALQDYGRAVIIGGQKSFGKGTVQRFIDLDEIVNGNYNTYKPFGALKLTFQKFYRITGESTQLKGVVPDIILPDQYKYIKYGEAELDHHLDWDKINTTQYQPTNSIQKKKDIVTKSTKRIKSNNTFSLLEQQAKSVKKYQDQTLVSLNLTQYRAEMAKRKQENDLYKNLFTDTTLLMVSPLKIDMEFIASDTAKVKSANEWHKKLKADPYLLESVEVVTELK
jgi:carboxyl-terminal processing protease